MRFLKKLLIAVYIYLGVFVCATLVIFTVTGNEPTALIGGTFGVAGVESLLAALIKSIENHKKESEDSLENGNISLKH